MTANLGKEMSHEKLVESIYIWNRKLENTLSDISNHVSRIKICNDKSKPVQRTQFSILFFKVFTNQIFEK